MYKKDIEAGLGITISPSCCFPVCKLKPSTCKVLSGSSIDILQKYKCDFCRTQSVRNTIYASTLLTLYCELSYSDTLSEP